ncbi:solute carrier organic anion transporter family member 74D [Anabrus simplex]|uniref:solute carrier organic anion transporter family member 74D n=1 Tax=Anabrus simplex TaxID=316456 RepID=UPI0035A39954
MPEAMIAPGELLHGDSLDGFVAPSGDMDHDQVRCGIGRFSSRCVQRFATAKCFMILLIILTLLQGSSHGYLTATVPVIAVRFGIPDSFVDWIMIGHEVTQGILALTLAFFGGRSCRPSWLAGCLVFQALCQLFMAVPFIAYGATAANTTASQKQEWLCTGSKGSSPGSEEADTYMFTMVVLVVAQVGAGVGLVSFLSHGITYLDDNTEKVDSPSLIGAVLCATQLGPKVGQVLAYWCSALSGASSGNLVSGKELNGAWWLGWPVLSSLMMITAFFTAMFPQRLPSMAVKEAAASILDLARTHTSIPEQSHVHISEQREYIMDPPSLGFCDTVKRLISNRMIMSNIMAMICMHTAMLNFSSYEDSYLESVYYIPKPEYAGGVFKDQWISRITTGFLKPPIVGMTLLLSGLIISRSQPRPRVLALWNVLIAAVAAIIFLIYISLDCPLLQVYGYEEKSLRLKETCNLNCNCPLNTPFQPICDRSGINTYYSPCHAGCTTVHTVDDIKLYENCSCISYGHMAKTGPCNSKDCTGKWVMFQSLQVLMVGLLGTGIVGNLLICLRCVIPEDKPALLGLELLLVGKMQVPGKIIYKWLIDSTCKHWGENNYNCRLFESDRLIANLNILTACLLLMSSFFDLFVWYFSRDLKLYSDEDIDDDTEDIALDDIQRMKISKRRATPALRRRRRDLQGIEVIEEEKDEPDEAEEDGELIGDSSKEQEGVKRINATLV